ncbi:putative telomere silencing protein [Golovinomyces cichoracearum]|uniref:Putative telomere silencing protein n=1 Tax=Golovinomyces cichoracearum TaxID=62708 RepID=A0A420HMY1_9PEZI|nr:putative telomere silencing protein [Golovinomyces cichoracearum]
MSVLLKKKLINSISALPDEIAGRTPRDIGVPYTASSREHVPQLSISDPNHHVTEAIGDLYGDENYLKYNPRLLNSRIPTSIIEKTEVKEPFLDPRSFSWNRSSDKENGNSLRHLKPSNSSESMKRNSFEANKISLSLSSNDEDISTSQLSLNDMNYETDPAEFAQALSNLQALRRMSIDAGSTSDPDLPLFQGASSMPSIAPTGDDKSDDPSRLFWVPARVHPELAPMEFKTFLENRVLSIKRQTGEQKLNLSDGLERNRSAGSSLSRKKSMLSRQINNSSSIGLSDKPEISENKNSPLLPKLKDLDLKEIDALVRNSSEAIRKLTLEKTRNEIRSGDTSEIEDIPILPQAPGIGLRRSTRTTYRRGSLRTGQRGNFSKRAASRKDDNLGERASSPTEEGASASHSEKIVKEDFSKSSRGARRLQNLQQDSHETSSNLRPKADDSVCRVQIPTPDTGTNPTSFSILLPNLAQKINTGLLDSPSDSQINTSPIERNFVPQVKEIPSNSEKYTDKVATRNPSPFPGRSSSQSQISTQKTSIPSNVNTASSKVPTTPISHNSPASVNRQNVNGSPQNVPSLPVSTAKTDTLTNPPLEIKKSDKKSRRDKEDPENHGSRKTTWNWFKGGDEKEKREKKKDDDREGKKSKKPSEKIHDNARLDVLQSTLDTGITIGRETVLFDRDGLEPRPPDEKKKESRKFSGDKKEKEGIFSSIFGGKKKTDRDGFGKKVNSFRTISPEPHLRYLKPDVDYNWTRFSILEERAIYRMAHLKLANPRRALYSQVLLSNFMYSYLAKVQQMHPHLQIPQSALQKKLETERRQKDQEQQAIQQIQESDQYRYDYHEGIAKYAEGGQINDNKPERVSYVDDSQIYDFDHRQDGNSLYGQGSNRPLSRASQHTSESGYEGENQHRRRGNEYYQHEDQSSSRDEDEMW